MTRSATTRFRFGVLFVGVARRWRRALDERIACTGLTDATWTPLVHLHRSGGGISQKELAALVGIDGSSLVRLLDILCRDGLVERQPDPDDRRARRLLLTPAGHAAVAELRTVLEVAEAEMLADVDDAELDAMMSALERIDTRLQLLRAAPGPDSGTGTGADAGTDTGPSSDTSSGTGPDGDTQPEAAAPMPRTAARPGR
ncbi:MarR family winged helix-turn-helix transcriptional regulator [Oceanicella sp. SM1341]|uniref:MarR family winged helix-turn-helix transcriptional regulator n=1 Tax=Oceanicella sp. SM1341 TaxID=1548889 RepID=UPI000E4A7145|nr:MarR family transcriptional regulator [Oceanicella sp. SM1341]